jgi:vacuolar-type H+-ATPase subunit E/Vma4
MALRDLIATMEEEARVQAEKIMHTAREQAARRLRDARGRLIQRRDEAIGRQRAALQLESRKLVANRRRAGRGEVLRLQWEVLEKVKEEARRQLPEAGQHKEYRCGMADAYSAALGYLPSESIKVRVSPAQARDISAGQGTTLKLVEDSSIRAGFVVSTADDSITVDQTLDRRLDDLWPALAIELTHRVTPS